MLPISFRKSENHIEKYFYHVCTSRPFAPIYDQAGSLQPFQRPLGFLGCTEAITEKEKCDSKAVLKFHFIPTKFQSKCYAEFLVLIISSSFLDRIFEAASLFEAMLILYKNLKSTGITIQGSKQVGYLLLCMLLCK